MKIQVDGSDIANEIVELFKKDNHLKVLIM